MGPARGSIPRGSCEHDQKKRLPQRALVCPGYCCQKLSQAHFLAKCHGGTEREPCKDKTWKRIVGTQNRV